MAGLLLLIALACGVLYVGFFAVLALVLIFGGISSPRGIGRSAEDSESLRDSDRRP